MQKVQLLFKKSAKKCIDLQDFSKSDLNMRKPETVPRDCGV